MSNTSIIFVILKLNLPIFIFFLTHNRFCHCMNRPSVAIQLLFILSKSLLMRRYIHNSLVKYIISMLV